MMYCLRRYDVFRCAQNDVAPFGRNDVMFAFMCRRQCAEGAHHSRSEHHSAKPTSFAEGKHHTKKHFCRKKKVLFCCLWGTKKMDLRF